MSDRKKIVSGIKPTGALHIGNYIGVVKQLIDMQDLYDSYIFVADYHSLTDPRIQNDPSKLNSIEIFIDYLALGLDPLKATIYKQSDVPEVTELAWIFNCLVTVPQLMRGHAYKDLEAKNLDINAGVLLYPVLMASDILIHNPDIVPIGSDQIQHLEMTREIARKFNNTYGETFTIPNEKIMEGYGTVLGIDGRKMSKSYSNTIEIFSSDEDIKKKVMSIVTDSKLPEEPKDPNKDTLFSLHKFFTPENDLKDIEKRYQNGSIGYKESKDLLATNMINYISPLRTRRREIASDREEVLRLLKDGGEKARDLAKIAMADIRIKVGIIK